MGGGGGGGGWWGGGGGGGVGGGGGGEGENVKKGAIGEERRGEGRRKERGGGGGGGRGRERGREGRRFRDEGMESVCVHSDEPPSETADVFTQSRFTQSIGGVHEQTHTHTDTHRHTHTLVKGLLCRVHAYTEFSNEFGDGGFNVRNSLSLSVCVCV